LKLTAMFFNFIILQGYGMAYEASYPYGI